MRMRDLLCGLIAAGTVSLTSAQTAIGTSFTYQGQLRDNDAAASGEYDLQFRLFNDTTQVGSTVCRDNIAVVDGVFTVTLDFGAQFDGNQRSIEIGVRPAGAVGDCASGGYTTLTPRQAITPAPYALKVAGIDGHSLDASDGSPANAVFVDANGAVGINTTTPSTSLTVNGNSDITGAIGIGRTPGGFQLDVRSPGNGVARFDSPDTYGTVAAFVNTSVGGASWAAVSSGSAHPGGAGKLVFRDIGNGLDRVTLDGSGRAGFGTTSPGMTVEVTLPTYYGGPALGVGAGSAWAYLHGGSNHSMIWNNTADMRFGVETSRGVGYVERMRMTATGRLGIGVSNPAEMLSVAGTIQSTTGGFRFPDNTVQSTASTNFWSASGANISNTNSGNVGIGNATPTSLLEVGPDAPLDNPGNFSTAVEINGRSGSGVSNPGSAAIVFTNSVFSTPLAWSMGVASNGEFTFNYNGTAGFDIVNVPKLRITGGSDVAEPFNVNSDGATERRSDEARPGMVVSIDPKNPGELRISTNKYDRTVAGIISGANGVNTGMVLTQKDSIADGQHPVALTGRVYCYVDADAAGAVQPGDLLTTSDTPGHAMKVRDHNAAQGAIIGKAMTSLESGKGMVLVLVNLQ